MLTDTIARRGFGTSDLKLFDGFLNPAALTDKGRLTPDEGAGAVDHGMVGQTGNEIDEFVDETLRNKLLGLPLDLAAINIARAREAGVPPLQAVRHVLRTDQRRRARAVRRLERLPRGPPAPRVGAQLHRGVRHDASSDPADGPRLTLVQRRQRGRGPDGRRGGHQRRVTVSTEIDLWVGGLAERHQVFGGMLGSTFNHVFERTMENLQFGDRFYYLSRTVGLNMLHQLEANSFATLVQRTTAASRLPANLFASQDTNVAGDSTVYDMDVVAPAWASFGSKGCPPDWSG